MLRPAKRSRKNFETSSIHPDTSPKMKRFRINHKNSNKSNHNSKHSHKRKISKSQKRKNASFECQVCFGEFMEHIYQCREGHLLCEECRPKFTKCPTCQVSLSDLIRNRALEQLLEQTREKYTCAFVSSPSSSSSVAGVNADGDGIDVSSSASAADNGCSVILPEKRLEKHLKTCLHRPIHCPFVGCSWLKSFHQLDHHLQNTHHTCAGSMQKRLSTQACNYYQFSHAIKFPSAGLHPSNKKNSDFMWPKLVKFSDGRKFFVLTRYYNLHVTVFVRLVQLPDLTIKETELLLRHCTNNNNANDDDSSDDSGDNHVRNNHTNNKHSNHSHSDSEDNNECEDGDDYDEDDDDDEEDNEETESSNDEQNNSNHNNNKKSRNPSSSASSSAASSSASDSDTDMRMAGTNLSRKERKKQRKVQKKLMRKERRHKALGRKQKKSNKKRPPHNNNNNNNSIVDDNNNHSHSHSHINDGSKASLDLNMNNCSFFDGAGHKYGEYFIELKVKHTNSHSHNHNNHNNNQQQHQIAKYHSQNPLRWPCVLYSINVPFIYEEQEGELLRIGQKIFEKYWTKNCEKGSAVLRFNFEIYLESNSLQRH